MNSNNVNVNNKKRRTTVPFRPYRENKVWERVKNYIGKPIDWIWLPIDCNAPITFLQFLARPFQNSEILDTAASNFYPKDQILYVAAFTIEMIHSATREYLPMRSVLGETYELDRSDDLGWKFFAEQISAEPNEIAMHCVSDKWTYRRQLSLASKFRGKYAQIFIFGDHLLEFRTGDTYIWKNLMTNIHGFINNEISFEFLGNFEITSTKSKNVAYLRFHPKNNTDKTLNNYVEGKIIDEDGEVRYIFRGSRDIKVRAARVVGKEKTVNGHYKYITGKYFTLWEPLPLPQDADKMYNFSVFDCQLNEMDDLVAPTDSRRRKDVRLLEEGKFVEAQQMYEKLHAHQPLFFRRNKTGSGYERLDTRVGQVTYTPVWFVQNYFPQMKFAMYLFTNQYFLYKKLQDWSLSPIIFPPDDYENE